MCTPIRCVAHGRKALLPFDWEMLARDDPAALAFFADAVKHGVGRNGLSVAGTEPQGRSGAGFLHQRP